MSKSVTDRRKLKKNIRVGTSYYRRKLHLLKHLRETKTKISKSLSLALLDEETRSKLEILKDLEPNVIPKPIFPDAEQPTSTKMESHDSRSSSTSVTPDSSDNIENMSYLPSMRYRPVADDITNSTDETSETGPSTKGQGLPETSKPAIYDYVLPSISELEESGLREFYNSFLVSASSEIANLNFKPGDDEFLFWFVASSYIPLLCSCSGPLSNMFSLLAIICPWKSHKVNAVYQPDPYWCYLINSISIVFAIVSNMFLLLNYRKKIRYTYCQIISIFGWGLACIILTALIIAYYFWFYNNGYNKRYVIAEGFYFATITVVLHFSNFILLLVNELGFLLRKYKPVFNINKTQETLIIQTIAICAWLIIGASIFTRMLNLTLAESFFYSILSVVTIGAQNYVPEGAVAAQTVTSLWIVCGLVMFGLIISSIRKMIVDFSQSTLYWHRSERLRKKLLKAHREDTGDLETNEDSFKLAQNISRWAVVIKGIVEVTCSMMVFFLTLFGGAMGFALFEGWTYRFSIYFCFFSFMTLGEGNATPSTPGGRALFCAWAIAAVPVMTILVSILSDFVFSKLTAFEQFTFSEVVIEFFISHKYLRGLGNFLKQREVNLVNKSIIEDLKTDSLLKVVDNQENSDKSVEPVPEIPLACHPVDMLYNVILNTNGLNSYDFINSKTFVRSNTATVQLANYLREGENVSLDSYRLYQAREKLAENFKLLDEKFDINKFANVYRINEDETESPISVVEPNNVIRTKFRKKHDFVLSRLSKIQLLLLQIRKSILDLCVDPDHVYTYEDWSVFYKVCSDDDVLTDPLFWIESRSPISVPINQPKFFILHYMRYLELYLQQFAAEWDER